MSVPMGGRSWELDNTHADVGKMSLNTVAIKVHCVDPNMKSHGKLNIRHVHASSFVFNFFTLIDTQRIENATSKIWNLRV